MARWTKSYKLPIKSNSSMCFAIGKEIWMISSFFDSPDDNIVIFNTETRSFTTTKSPPPYTENHFNLWYTAVSKDQIYWWFYIKRTENGDNKTLYKLDTKTLQWEHILTAQKEYESCVVIGDLMYVLDCPNHWSGQNKDNELNPKTYVTILDTIDLKKKEVIDSYELMKTEISFLSNLTTNDGKLYLIQTEYKDYNRLVSIVEDGKLRVICEDKCNIEQDRKGPGGAMGIFRDLFFQWTDNHSIFGIDTFNYLENQWERTTAKKSWVDERFFQRSYDFCEIDGVFYAFLDRVNRFWLGQEIRLLEKSPDASTLSLLNMIDFCVDNDEMDRLKECGENVPEANKEDWERMIDWRIEEHKFNERVELVKRRADAGKIECQKLLDEGIMCNELSRVMEIIL